MKTDLAGGERLERAVGVMVVVVLIAAGVAALLMFWDDILPKDDFASLSLPIVALAAAVAATFNPCSLPALPAFVVATGAAGANAGPRQRAKMSLAAAAGAAAVVIVLGVIVAFVGAETKDLIEPRFRWVQLVSGIVLVAVAVLHFSGQSSRLPLVGRIMALGSRIWDASVGKPTMTSSAGWGAGFVAIGAG